MLKVKASIKGCSTEALINTGSPVSLISIDFLLHALIKNLDSVTTQEDITKTLQARLEYPQLMVRNFGGDTVNVVGQATVTLCYREHSSQVTLLVQKGTQYCLVLMFWGSLAFKAYSSVEMGKHITYCIWK